MEHIVEQQRSTPVIDHVDVLVAGGGFGGIAAALAAVRQGKKVMLCEREFALGGLGTLGLVTIYLPLCNGLGQQMSFSIAEELLRLSVKHGSDTHRYPVPTGWLENGTLEEKLKCRFRTHYHPWFFVPDVEQLLKKEGVQILYGTCVVDVQVENSKITSVILDNIDGRTAVEVKAVVDATGNAVVAKLAGEDTAQYPNGNVPSSWYYYAGKDGVKLSQFGPKDITGTKGDHLDPALAGRRFSGLDARENSEMLIFSREKMLEDIEKKREEDPTLFPVMISTIQELRMTRSVAGVEQFKAENVGKRCESSIGCIGNWTKKDPGHEIPFGSLHGSKIQNLIAAGRCTAADADGWNLTRVIPACSVTGEAAGMAAAMTDDFTTLDVTAL